MVLGGIVMRTLFGRACAVVVTALVFAAGSAGAAEPVAGAEATAAPAPGADASAKRLKQDAVCTRCHDESESKPLLSIYQTRHGVTADARTPACQNCHGTSDKHVAGGKGEGNASRPAPDVVFGTRTTVNPATEALKQEETCLACHRAGKRLYWDASQHQSHDVPCSACHTVHVKSDPVLSKGTQPEVCYTCHKTQRAQTHLVSTHPIDAGLMAC
jgi:DmsE family decaheme c-type cytochrome